MSFGVGLGDLALIINGCITIYKSLKDAGEQIDDVSDRLQEVLDFIRPIERHLNEKYGAAKKYPEAKTIRGLVDKMKSEAQSIKAIFKRYHEIESNNPAAAFFGKLLYIGGSSNRQLEALITTIERRAASLDRQVNLMDHVYQHQQIQRVINKPLSGTVKQRSVNILFIDADNVGRSVVSQAYTHLVAQWTKRTGGIWHIKMVNSGGFQIRDSLLGEQQQQILTAENLQAKKNVAPNQNAMDALFDNDRFNYPYKQDVKENCSKHRSRTLHKDDFSTYDYVFVYTFKHLEQLQRLKALVKQKHGTQVVPRAKAKIVLLGEYRNGGADTDQIEAPGEDTRKAWNTCVVQLKTAFRNWLTEELGWKKPPRGAKQD